MGQVDTSPERVVYIRAAKRVAASAQSEGDNYTQPTTKRAWNYKGTGQFGGGRDIWAASGKGEPKRKGRRHGKCKLS